MSAEQCLIYVSVNKNILNKNQTKANLATDWVPVELSTEVFAQVIKNGWAYSAWFTDYRRSKDNFAGINIASVDIDGTRSIDETIRDPFCEQYLSLLYTTHSHTTENPRFRLVFLLQRVIENPIEYRHILQALSTKLKGDPSATDPSRLFYGNTNASITTWDRSLTEEAIGNLLKTYPRQDLFQPGQGPTTLVLQSSSPLNEELDLLDSHGKAIKLGEIKARISVFCPFHSDTNPSAFVGIKPNGERFLHCSKCKSTWHQKSKFLKNAELYDFQNVLKKVSALDLDQRLEVLNRLSDDYLEKTSIEKTAEAGIQFVSDRHFKLPEIIEGLTLIKSPKGTGKTESVSARIVDSMFKRRQLTLADFEELEPDSDSPPQSLTERTQYRVLLIGHRQALIRSLCKRFNLHCYLDEVSSYDIRSRKRDQYGVCIDSIYKVSFDDRPYDIVIIDESEQVLAHFLSTTMRDRLSFYQGFSNIIRHAKSVIAMDADLGWTTYLTLTSIRSKSPLTRGKNKLLIYINDYVAPNQKLKIYESKSQLISEIWVDIRLGKKIFISSNSKERVQKLDAKIKEDFSSIEVLSITSENSTEESVQEFISNVRFFAPKYQVILASPSLGTGVDISFDNNQVVFDCVYGIFETPINTHTEIDQQISRVRNPKEVKIWISPRKFNFESDFQVIKAELLPSNVVANTAFSISNSIASAVFSDQSGDFIRLAALVLSEQMRSKNALKSNYIRYKQKGGWSMVILPFCKGVRSRNVMQPWPASALV